MKKLLKKWAIRLIGIILFIALVSNLNLNSVKKNLFSYHITHILFLVFLTLTFLLFKSIRWWFLLKQYEIKIHFLKSTLHYLSGIYLGLVTPARVGDLSKAFYLKTYKKLPLSQGIIISIVDRILDLSTMITITYLFFSIHLMKLNPYISGVILFIFFSFLIMIYWNKNSVRNIFSLLLNFIIRDKSKFHSLKEIKIYPVNINIIFTYFFTLLATFILITQAYLISIYIGLDTSLIYTGGAIVSANLIALLPISIMGIGTRESALILFIQSSSREIIISFSVSFLIISNIISAMIGFFCWSYIHFIEKTPKQIEDNAITT